MAAEKDLPLETIIIIVAIIVVLFIAIFFGALFLRKNINKRKSFNNDTIGNNERSGGGKRKYNGGTETDDKAAVITFIYDDSIYLLSDKYDDNYLAGVDTIHNMFRSCDVDVPDGPMENFYYPLDKGDAGQPGDWKGFKKIINALTAEQADWIAKSIESVKIVLHAIKKAHIADIQINSVNKYTHITETIKKSDLKDLLVTQLKKVYDSTALNSTDLQIFNQYISDNDIYNINQIMYNFKEVKLVADNIIGYLFKTENLATEDDYDEDYDKYIVDVNTLLYACDYFAEEDSIKDVSFYSLIDNSKYEHYANIISQIYEPLKGNEPIGMYILLYKFGNRTQLINTILEPSDKKFSEFSEGEQKWLTKYFTTEFKKLNNIKFITDEFEKLESTTEVIDLKKSVTDNGGGGAGKVATVDPDIKKIEDLLTNVKKTYDDILDFGNTKISIAERFKSLNDGLKTYGEQLVKCDNIKSTVIEINKNQETIKDYITHYYTKFKWIFDTKIFNYFNRYENARDLTTRNMKNIFNTKDYSNALLNIYISNTEQMLDDNTYFSEFIKQNHIDILEKIERIKDKLKHELSSVDKEYKLFLDKANLQVSDFEQIVNDISSKLDTEYDSVTKLFIAKILQDGINKANIKQYTKRYINNIKQISDDTDKKVKDDNLENLLLGINTVIKDFKPKLLVASANNVFTKYNALKNNIKTPSAYKTFQDAVINKLNPYVNNAEITLENNTDAVGNTNIVDKINQALQTSNNIFESNNCVEIINKLGKVIAKPIDFDTKFTAVSTKLDTLNKSIIKFIEDTKTEIIGYVRVSTNSINEAETERTGGKDVTKIKMLQGTINNIFNTAANNAQEIYNIFTNISKTILYVKQIVPKFDDLYSDVSENYTKIEQHYLRIQAILVDLAAVATITEKLVKIDMIKKLYDTDKLGFIVKYNQIKDSVNKDLSYINSLFDSINKINSDATKIIDDTATIVVNISDQTINNTKYAEAINDQKIINASQPEIKKQYDIADPIKTGANTYVPALLQSIDDGITKIYNGFDLLVNNGFDNSNDIEVDKFINIATSELDTIKKEKNTFNVKIDGNVDTFKLVIPTIGDAVKAAEPEYKKLIDAYNQFIQDAMSATIVLVNNINTQLKFDINTKNQEITNALNAIKTKNNDIVEPNNTAIKAHDVYTEIKAITNQNVTNITNNAGVVRDPINTKFAIDLETIQQSFTNADTKLKTKPLVIADLAVDLKSVNDIHKNIIADNIIAKFDKVLLDIEAESVKLDPHIEIAELMKEIDKNHTATITAQKETKTATEETIATTNKVIAHALDAQSKADEADNTEQTAISLIGSINDKDVSSELAKLKRRNNEMNKLNKKIRTNNTDPLKKAEEAKSDADTAIAEADAQLATFTTPATAVLYTQNLAYWETNYNTKHTDAKKDANAAKDAAEKAKTDAEQAQTDAANALADAKPKLDNINMKIALIRSIFDRIKQLIDDINNEDDDGPSITPQQPEDDTVKPFSKESYDILPLDSKVATLSSNIQFDETKSTAMNNPGNSFMYKIVSYDSKELSSDDKILEIISFARTQRMPIKDSNNIIAKATELIKKYRGTNKIIPGAWIYRGGKWFASVKPTKIEELERYVELMKRENQFEIPRATGGGHRLRI